jgi:sugar phosphate isomerase/epimerase
LKQLTELAESLDLQLWLENEKGLVGDIPERNYKLVTAVDSPALQFIWDPANFVQCGAEKQVDEWWEKLGPYTKHVHIKDAKLENGEVTPGGEGDGQVKELLTQLKANGFTGILALEPHLAIAGHSSGFSGADGMEVAVTALRKVMVEVGIEES